MTQGLTSHKAQELLKEFGFNKLPEKQATSAAVVFIRQIKNPFTYLLFGAAILSVFVGDKLDSLLIGGILVLNIFLGFWQEFKASKELEALRKMEVGFSRVLRDGKQIEVLSTELVPGDVVILESGNKVPADAQILESFSLQVNESILTGESLPVMKSPKKKENLIFFGTIIVSGRAVVHVLQTGIKTKFGLLAETLSNITDEQTPFEKSLAGFSKIIGLLAVAISVIVFILRLLQGYDIASTMLGSIALMVAVVPEGLPAVVTIILALGMRKMYRKEALVRKMIAVESLGTATVICTDKTGTLTKNEMRVKEIEIKDGKKDDLFKCAVYCNSASLVMKEDPSTSLRTSWDILGDTTEGALLLWAKDQGLNIDLMRSQGKLVEEIPFNLETRKMTVFREEDEKRTEYTKGAPEVLLVESKLSKLDLEKWEKKYQQMAQKGLRVLAFLRDGEFLGLTGIADEIRPEVKEAIAKAKQAGIKVVMVTGDNELTARTIGEEIGLLSEGDEIMTGSQLNDLNEEELLKRIGKVKIFARITPEEKLRIVKAYQSLGETVAVTGDGVNDVLALKQAAVGVSMGITGTDVSKEASDIILLDDNFATLITAIEQGRLIYNNILKVIKFLLTGNLSEMLLIIVGVMLGWPAPLLPIQILWINFVTDGPPALALGFDNASSHLMQVPPRKNLSLLGRDSLRFIVIGGVTIAALCLLVFYFTNSRAVTFTLMVILQMVLPFIMRRHHGILSNKKLLISAVAIILFQILILTYQPLRSLFL